MKRMLIALLVLFVSAFSYAQLKNDEYELQNFDLNINSGVRAIAAVNDSTCWFAGSNGVFGYTEDGGRSWSVDSIKLDTLRPEFRAMAVLNSKTVLLLCTGSPAYLLKTTDKGKTWRTVYSNDHPNIFFDAMKFRDQQNASPTERSFGQGIAVGDPVDSCFIIIKTTDGGETWMQMNCSKIPKALDGEACFASSNSNICFIGNNAWIATGGKYSRILKSDDAGLSWKVYETPVISGSQMTGTYTMDFFDSAAGIIAGGNYDAKENASNNKAVTTDGGKTWTIVANEKPPGLVSCIQYSPKGNGKTVLASCLPGIFISHNGGTSWENINSEAKYYTFRYAPSGNAAWFAGAKGKLGKMKFNK